MQLDRPDAVPPVITITYYFDDCQPYIENIQLGDKTDQCVWHKTRSFSI